MEPGFLNLLKSPYQADPSGVISANAAMTQALADANALGRPIYIPPGEYNLQGFTSTYTGNIVIVGAGSRLVRINGTLNTRCFTAGENSKLLLANLSFMSFKRVVSFTAASNVDEVIIEDCDFDSIGLHVVGSAAGVDLTSLGRFVYRRNTSNNVGISNGDVSVVRISASTCPKSTVVDNEMNNTGLTTKTGRTFAVYIKNQDPLVNAAARSIVSRNMIDGVRNNDFGDCVGIMVLGGTTNITDNHLRRVLSSLATNVDNEGIYTKARNSIIGSNTLEDCGGNEGTIICKGRNRGHIDPLSADGFDNVISDNVIISTGLALTNITGIALTTDGCVVGGNNIIGGQRGIACRPELRASIIRSNNIQRLVSNGVHDVVIGIAVDDSNGTLVHLNSISELSSSGSAYAIEYKTSAIASDGVAIKNNWIRNVTATTDSNARGIATSINGGSTVEKVIITGNDIDKVGWAILANGIDSVTHSSCIENTVSGALSGTIAPLSPFWSVYANNS